MRAIATRVAVVAIVIALSATTALAGKAADSSVNPGDFVSTIDNPYLPLVPGTTFFYEARTADEFIVTETAVTHDKKKILGVDCTVVLDRVWENGVLVERTYDWYAQDTSGNVWYFGEYSENLDAAGNVVSTAGSWEAGVDSAEPGIIMQAHPKKGMTYRQEFYEGLAEDMAKIVGTGLEVEIGFGEFDDCLKIKEWTPLSPGSVEHKYYAPGIGLVLVEERHGKTVNEELVSIVVGR